MDGVVEEDRDEVFIARNEVPFGEPDPSGWLRKRRAAHDVPSFDIFPKQG
jgi:hypothetical protein